MLCCRGVGSGGGGGGAAPPKLFEWGPEYLSPPPPKTIYAIILQNILFKSWLKHLKTNHKFKIYMRKSLYKIYFKVIARQRHLLW